MGNKKQSGERAWRDVSTFAGGPGRKWTLWASAAVLVALVGISTLVLIPRPDPAPPTSAPRPTSTPAAEESDDTASSTEGMCPAVAIDEDAVTVPEDLAWVSAHGNSWPVSESVGPKVDVEGLGHCFDRSPIGAALAAVGLAQSARAADIDTAHRILDTQYVQNKGKDIAADNVDRTYPDYPPGSRPLGRVMGFRVEFFHDDMAQVLLVEDWPEHGQYTGYLVTLVWSDGDWKMRLLDDGRPSPGGDITVDPDAFTRWEQPR